METPVPPLPQRPPPPAAAPVPPECALDDLLALAERLAAAPDRDAVAREALDGLLALVPGPVAVFRRYDPDAGLLVPVAARGWPPGERPPRAVGLDEGALGAAVRAGALTAIPDIDAAPGSLPLLRPDTPRALLVIPVVRGDTPLGCATLGRPRGVGFAPGECRLAGAVARQAAIALAHIEQLGRARDLYLASVRSLAAAVDARDAYTHRHSRNVADHARAIARELGLPPAAVETVELAALLHDIGKIGIPDAILGKTGRLTTAELSVMATHPTQGTAILAANDALAPLVPLVRHHHEWWNGAGYPDGLAGAQIPLGAAIIAVADAFDTMTTDRAYRRARTPDAACAELEREAGRQFHPDVVAAFVRTQRRDPGAGVPDPACPGAGVPDPACLAATATGTPGGAGGRTLVAEQREAVAGQIRPQQLKELAVLHHLARTIGALTDLDAFLAGALAVIAREFGEHACALLLRDERGAGLTVRAASGFDPAIVGRGVGRGASALDALLASGRARRIPRIAQDARYAAWDPASRAALLVPLVRAGEALGAIAIEAREEDAFSADDELTLETIANQLAVATAVARLHDREKRAAITDGLTGAHNHRHFYQQLERELAQADRAGRPLAVLLLDLNGLKALNDAHGHRAGDAALRAVADLLAAGVRAGDTVARYGGDEFALLLPGTGAGEAEALVGRLRAGLAATVVRSDGVALEPLAVAVGAAYCPADGRRAAALVAAADARMYRQKRATRPPTVPTTGPARPGRERARAPAGMPDSR